jgi:hypothetical protein
MSPDFPENSVDWHHRQPIQLCFDGWIDRLI